MNELSTMTKQLPDTLPDLSKFALIGREKLNAVRAEIRAIEKVGLAKEVHEQKLLEAQEIAEAVLDAEAKIGELTAKIPKASGNYAESENRPIAKNTVTAGMGMSKDQVSRFERLAKHPEAIQQAKTQAREDGRIVTRQDVFKTIAANAPVPQHRNPLREAKKRHAEYEKSKRDSIVNFADIVQDKSDKEKIAQGVYNDLMTIISKINAVSAFNTSETISNMRTVLEAGQKTFMIERISHSITILQIIKERLEGIK